VLISRRTAAEEPEDFAAGVSDLMNRPWGNCDRIPHADIVGLVTDRHLSLTLKDKVDFLAAWMMVGRGGHARGNPGFG